MPRAITGLYRHRENRFLGLLFGLKKKGGEPLSVACPGYLFARSMLNTTPAPAEQ